MLMNIGKWTRFAKEYLEFRSQEERGRGVFRFGKLYPCLDDRSQDIEARGHYFHQDLLVAQKIFLNNPVKHVDVGSRMDGLVAHVASFREIEVLDIRPLNVEIRNVKFTNADVTRDDFVLTDYCDSLSSLHAVEHFGLGRYGDVIDHVGYLKGLEALYNMLKVGGKFYVSFPIGSQRVEFNAHRIFSMEFLLDLFENHYVLDSFSCVDDDGNLVKNPILEGPSLESSFSCEYGCGIFELTKVKTDAPFIGRWRIGMSHEEKRPGVGQKRVWSMVLPLLKKLFPGNPLESGCSSTRSERKLAEELKDAVSTLKKEETDDVGLEKDWQGKLKRLRHLVSNGNLGEFLRWDVIQETMFVANEPYVEIELQHLKRSLYWNRLWRSAIEEIVVGHPIPYRGWPRSSGNLIHHAYHICRFQEETGIKLDALDLIFEFGGGYGSMCRLFHNLKFKGKYIIFDLPPFAELQRYYLRMVGIPVLDVDQLKCSGGGVFCMSNVWDLKNLLADKDMRNQTASFFIATWSISEAPLPVRSEIMKLVRDFRSFLFAYQDEYAGVDNSQYFKELLKEYRKIDWMQQRIEHLPGNSYIFGNWQRTVDKKERGRCSK